MGNAAPPIKRLREEPHCECNVGSIIASAVPFQDMGMTSHLYQVTPGYA